MSDVQEQEYDENGNPVNPETEQDQGTDQGQSEDQPTPSTGQFS